MSLGDMCRSVIYYVMYLSIAYKIHSLDLNNNA
jgi:hypothetical protein